jgi:hypothetical protein
MSIYEDYMILVRLWLVIVVPIHKFSSEVEMEGFLISFQYVRVACHCLRIY